MTTASPLPLVTLLVFLLTLCGHSVVSAARGAASQTPPGYFERGVIHPLPFSNIPNSNVTDITHFKDITQLIRSDETPYLIYFYDSLDVNSVRLSPTIQEAANLLQGFVEVVAMDSRNPKLQWILNAWSVQVLPSVKMLPVQGGIRKQYERSPVSQIGHGVKQPIDYEKNDYSAEGIKKFAMNYLSSHAIERVENDGQGFEVLKHATEASSASAEKTTGGKKSGGGEMNVVVLYTDKDQTSQLYKAVSAHFSRRLRFFEVIKRKASKAVKHFKVEKFPTLMVFFSSSSSVKSSSPLTYEGKLNVEELNNFLEKFAMSKEKKESLRSRRDRKIIAREVKRSKNPVLQIKTVEEYFELLQRQKISGILFLNSNPASSPSSKEKLQVVAEVSRRGKTTVSQYVWIDQNENPELLKFFFGSRAAAATAGHSDDGDNDDAGNLVFLSTKKSLYTKFLGAFTPDSIVEFISAKLAQGIGAKSFKMSELPNFVEATGSDDDEE